MDNISFLNKDKIVNPKTISTATFPIAGNLLMVPESEFLELGVVRMSDKQPAHVGYPYGFFMQTESLRGVAKDSLLAFANRGMRMEKKQPLFLKTGIEHVYVTFRYGDLETAVQAAQLFARSGAKLYKNWK